MKLYDNHKCPECGTMLIRLDCDRSSHSAVCDCKDDQFNCKPCLKRFVWSQDTIKYSFDLPVYYFNNSAFRSIADDKDKPEVTINNKKWM